MFYLSRCVDTSLDYVCMCLGKPKVYMQYAFASAFYDTCTSMGDPSLTNFLTCGWFEKRSRPASKFCKVTLRLLRGGLDGRVYVPFFQCDPHYSKVHMNVNRDNDIQNGV